MEEAKKLADHLGMCLVLGYSMETNENHRNVCMKESLAVYLFRIGIFRNFSERKYQC